MTISPLRDSETLRQQRNLTSTQKRANTETKEGVLVNNFIKDCPECKVNLEDTCDTLVISENSKMPSKLYEKNNSPEKSILPISAIAVGVMGTITLLSAFVKYVNVSQHTFVIFVNTVYFLPLFSTILTNDLRLTFQIKCVSIY